MIIIITHVHAVVENLTVLNYQACLICLSSMLDFFETWLFRIGGYYKLIKVWCRLKFLNASAFKIVSEVLCNSDKDWCTLIWTKKYLVWINVHKSLCSYQLISCTFHEKADHGKTLKILILLIQSYVTLLSTGGCHLIYHERVKSILGKIK